MIGAGVSWQAVVLRADMAGVCGGARCLALRAAIYFTSCPRFDLDHWSAGQLQKPRGYRTEILISCCLLRYYGHVSNMNQFLRRKAAPG